MEVKLIETAMNNLPPDPAIPAGDARQESATSHPERRSCRPGDDLVRWCELRLALWIGGFALAAILGGQGFLYSAIMGLQGEMHTQVGDLRTDMQTQFTDLRERVARMETRLDPAADPDD